MASVELSTAESVRRLMVDEHEELRPLLDELEALAERFEEGGEAAGRILRQRASELYQRFAWHLDGEERHLSPRLRAAGGPGKRLADQLDAEHREQRESCSATSSAAWAPRAPRPSSSHASCRASSSPCASTWSTRSGISSPRASSTTERGPPPGPGLRARGPLQ
jgi:hypothetical protein